MPSWDGIPAHRPGFLRPGPQAGDGSGREQAASCQRVLGGCANLCAEFSTKRYRSMWVNRASLHRRGRGDWGTSSPAISLPSARDSCRWSKGEEGASRPS